MGAWIFCFFLLEERLHAHKIPRFGGGGGFRASLERGGSVILFLWARGFPDSVKFLAKMLQNFPSKIFCKLFAPLAPFPTMRHSAQLPHDSGGRYFLLTFRSFYLRLVFVACGRFGVWSFFAYG